MSSRWLRPEVLSSIFDQSHSIDFLLTTLTSVRSGIIDSSKIRLVCFLCPVQVYPLFAATGAAVGICAFSLIRNITGNPEVRCTKENRAAGILDNHAEGEKYKENFLRKYVRDKRPEIMPGLNKFFTDPTY
ncbi:hypothetical protein HID58_055330 [Brassica napus]|uniref:(rape) hypothetical protein n=1 Tax=Brassica napus TaxID=3708 RepID=A0A816IED8_BRANA|nr:hypothetical protein HID58_055322 [Brassica napus]KAH0892901.1 hypothetical protein HID58_055330 [Brassica napus]CAF1708040.1 unnamed protein product [Brassica napus]CAF1708058.1 unnamed protein product [Brassica napus]